MPRFPGARLAFRTWNLEGGVLRAAGGEAWVNGEPTEAKCSVKQSHPKGEPIPSARCSCLARGSLVLTQDGYRMIEDVEVGDLVLTHRGRWRPVLASLCQGEQGTIVVRGHGVAKLRLTPDHRVLAFAHNWPKAPKHDADLYAATGRQYPTAKQRLRLHGADWMTAESLEGKYALQPLPPASPSSYSAEDWWVVGRWLGDGYYHSGGSPLICCAHEETHTLVAALGPRAGHVAERPTTSVVFIRDANGKLRDLLRRCGRGASGKRVPLEALELEPQKAEALLAGYLSADGNEIETTNGQTARRYPRTSAKSISRSLVLGMAMVAQRARGIVPSVFPGPKGGTAVIEGRSVTTRDQWVLSFGATNSTAFVEDETDNAWKRVRTVESSEPAEVWDLQVAEDESFLAEGCVVHNCGLHGFHRPPEDLYVHTGVLGAVVMWGQIARQSDGFRAQYALPVALCKLPTMQVGVYEAGKLYCEEWDIPWCETVEELVEEGLRYADLVPEEEWTKPGDPGIVVTTYEALPPPLIRPLKGTALSKFQAARVPFQKAKAKQARRAAARARVEAKRRRP